MMSILLLFTSSLGKGHYLIQRVSGCDLHFGQRLFGIIVLLKYLLLCERLCDILLILHRYQLKCVYFNKKKEIHLNMSGITKIEQKIVLKELT